MFTHISSQVKKNKKILLSEEIIIHSDTFLLFLFYLLTFFIYITIVKCSLALSNFYFPLPNLQKDKKYMQKLKGNVQSFFRKDGPEVLQAFFH